MPGDTRMFSYERAKRFRNGSQRAKRFRNDSQRARARSPTERRETRELCAAARDVSYCGDIQITPPTAATPGKKKTSLRPRRHDETEKRNALGRVLPVLGHFSFFFSTPDPRPLAPRPASSRTPAVGGGGRDERTCVRRRCRGGFPRGGYLATPRLRRFFSPDGYDLILSLSSSSLSAPSPLQVFSPPCHRRCRSRYTCSFSALNY